MVCIYNGILYSHQKKQNLAICNDIDGTRGYYEQNKSIRERQLLYDLSDMRNLRGNVEGLGARDGENETRRDLEETNHKRLLISQNKLRVAGEWGRVGIVWLGDGHWGGYVV